MQRKRAFTLIELLVVIAIIAILAAILFPVFAKARERAKQSASLNNVKQLTLGVITYAQDYDQTFPGWVQASATTYAHNTWDEQINSQIKSKDVFSNGQTGIKSPSDPQKQRVLTYGMNGALFTTVNGAGQAVFSGVSGTAPPAILSPGSVTNPSDTILFAEIVADGPTLITSNAGAVSQPPSGTTNNTPSDTWVAAMPSGNSAAGAVIDISPRDWVQVAGKPGVTATGWYDDKDEAGWAAASQYGVARDLYGGGGTYGFVDGHVKFMKIKESVGLDKRVGTLLITPQNVWQAANTENKWYPSR